MSYITAIGTAVPANRFEQSDICRFMELIMAGGADDIRRKIKAVFRASGISHRHSVLDDYGKTEDFLFYPNDPGESFPSTDKRMRKYREAALPLSVSAYNDMRNTSPIAPSSITHLIIVSCTGMYAPGLDFDLVNSLGLSRNVARTCIQFMGCYAAFNALRVADAICASKEGQAVLIVCTELCSLHFQHTPDEDNILANALFADGSACVLVESGPSTEKSLEIRSFHSLISGGGSEHMAWNVGDEGFRMRLSSYIPDLIEGEVLALTRGLLAQLGCGMNDIKHQAVHPGGVRILQAVEKSIGVSREKFEESYQVLRNYGNMSSATVLFVLKEILKRISVKEHGDLALSMGFGPGLTLESMLLQVNHR